MMVAEMNLNKFLGALGDMQLRTAFTDLSADASQVILEFVGWDRTQPEVTIPIDKSRLFIPEFVGPMVILMEAYAMYPMLAIDRESRDKRHFFTVRHGLMKPNEFPNYRLWHQRFARHLEDMRESHAFGVNVSEPLKKSS